MRSRVKVARRRRRNPYLPLGRASQIRALLDRLRQDVPGLPDDFATLYRLLCAARNTKLRIGKDSRGRPTKYDPILINNLRHVLTRLLDEVTVGSISLSSFVDNQLRLLHCPNDLQQAVEASNLTIQEALILSRVKDDTLRRKLLQTHLLEQGSDRSLMRKVKAVLAEMEPAAIAAGYASERPEDTCPSACPSNIENLFDYAQSVEELGSIGFGAADLFGEQARFIIECLRELNIKDVNPDVMGALLRYTEGFSALLHKILKRQSGEG